VGDILWFQPGQVLLLAERNIARSKLHMKQKVQKQQQLGAMNKTKMYTIYTSIIYIFYQSKLLKTLERITFLVAKRVHPPVALISVIMAAYCDGEVATVTYAWFFDDDRSIDGPPMSTFSMQVSKFAPDATVASKA
jgi:hypothetical protein